MNNEELVDEYKPWGLDLNPFCMLMYISIFIGGPILTLIMWLTNREKNPYLDQHGKNIFNWILSCIIYSFGCIILMFILIGFLLWFALIVSLLVLLLV